MVDFSKKAWMAAFPAGVFVGSDAYRYSTGLVGAADAAVRGDPTDPDGSPGVLAAGALLEVAAPLLRRVTFGCAIRVKSSRARDEVAQAARSAVAGAVNGRRDAGPIPISELLAAVQAVPGVESVVPTGTYAAGADLIPVPAGSRGRVLAETDVSVIFSED